MHILDSLLAFSAYFFIGVAMVIIFLFIYSKITPHNEWQLIKNNNTAAALAFSGTLLGYVIPLSSAAINAVSIPDYFAWGGIALVIQLLVFAGEQMFKQVIEEIQPEPFIVSPELDNEINKAVLDLLHNPHEGVGLVEITNRYKNDKSN